MSEHFWWHLSRSSGLIGWAILTASLAFGLTLSTRLFGRGVAPAWLLDLHRHLGGLALGSVGLHVVALVADSYVEFGVRDVLVPMAVAWKPGPVAWGIVAMWLMLLIQVTSWLMRRMPRRVWRAIHHSSFAVFVMVALHAFTAGTDASRGVVQVGTLSAVMTVMFLTIVRMLAERGARRRAGATS
jgi:DMSO/TMAO reductase YedYZ heme-binding membrane subunit